MNKTVTHNKSYMSLLENSLNELFSPSSKKSLLDYNQLKLVNVEELKVIDFNSLKLLDMKGFHLLNLALLSVFFQYIGALFLTMSLGFMVGFGAFTIHRSINSVVFAEGNSVINASKHLGADNLKTYKAELVKAKRGTTTQRSGFAELIDASETKSNKTEAVLGASSDSKSCSFRVVEGKKSARFSSGSKYSPSKVFKLCVDSNQKSSAFGWDIDSNQAENTSDCITSYELEGAKSISATLVDEAGNLSGSCQLSLVKSAIIAAK